MKPIASSLIGGVLAAAAAMVMGGWMLREPAMVAPAAGAPIVFDTALCFFLAGIALAVDAWLPARTERRVRIVAGGTIALLALLVLLEHATGRDLGVDWPGLHRWMYEGHPTPGRMSLPTSAAFLLAGSVLMLLSAERGLWGGVAVQAATLWICLFGAIGVIGRVLRLELVYPEYFFSQMALVSACALVALGGALWLRWRRLPWYAERNLISREDERVSVAGAAVLALSVCISALAGFAVTSHQIEALARNSLLEPLKGRIDLFRINLDLRSTRAALAGTRTYLVDLLAVLHRKSGDVEAAVRLHAEAQSLLGIGFSGVAFDGAGGERRAAAGSFVQTPQLALELDLAFPATLLWHEGFVLHSRIPVRNGGEVVGAVVTEQRLAALTDALASADDFAQTAEIVVCGRPADALECVRQRPDPPVFRIAYSASLPIAQALRGATGVAIERDYRGHYVIAAHGPVGVTGLGMVIKTETAELYAPLRSLLHVILILLLASVAAGAWLLRLRIAPLVRRLASSEQRLALALEGSRLALWDYDVAASTVYLDERWLPMLGGAPRQSTARPEELMALVHPDDAPIVQQHLREVLAGSASHYDVEHRVRTASGEWLWIRSRGRLVERDAKGRPRRLAGTNADIHLRKLAELQLAHQAGHDPLTGLPNRALFQDRLARALARSRRGGALMAVMYLDIDRFKAVNDQRGHDVGDALIREFARRLGECIRATDTAARLGGDEFAVILESVEDRATGRQIAEKIVVAMRREFLLDEVRLAVSTSVGVAYYDGQELVAADAIVKRADEALYRAKAAGRDTFRVSDETAA